MDNTHTDQQPPPPWETRFRRELRRLRTASGQSQNSLATELSRPGQEFHQQQIDRIENGTRKVRLNEAMRIATYFNTTLDEMARVPSERREDLSKLAARSHDLASTAEQRLMEFQRACLALVADMGEGESLIRQLGALDGSEKAPSEELVSAVNALASMLDGLGEAAKSALRATAQVTLAADASSTLLVEWRATPTQGGMA
jgi:transcriptional regulator with XRE-family HTH domain